MVLEGFAVFLMRGYGMVLKHRLDVIIGNWVSVESVVGSWRK